jgi:hypothetical protein
MNTLDQVVLYWVRRHVRELRDHVLTIDEPNHRCLSGRPKILPPTTQSVLAPRD